MVRQHEDGEMEVPYNVYNHVVARRQFEDNDLAKEMNPLQKTTSGRPSVKAIPIKPVDVDVKKDPVIFNQ